MKHFFAIPLLVLAAACSTTTDPAQRALNTTADTCKGVGSSVLALDAAAVSGSVSKATAQAALKGLTAANEGCRSALAVLQSASGVK